MLTNMCPQYEYSILTADYSTTAGTVSYRSVWVFTVLNGLSRHPPQIIKALARINMFRLIK